MPTTPSFDSQAIPDGVRWRPDDPPRDWTYIVLHHTATNRGSVESIHNSHLRNKDKNGNSWLGIGYHFVIGNGQGMADGEIEPTFRWRRQLHGAHAGVGDYNAKGIGVVLVGNFEQAPPTEAQIASLTRLVRYLSQTYAIEADNVLGHGDIKATDCPGQHFPLSAVRASVAALDDSGGLPLARFVPATGIPRKEALR